MMVLCLSSPIGGLLEWFWLGTALTRPEIVWGCVILAGVAVALTPGKIESRGGRFAIGIVAGMVAAICQALGAVLSRKAFGDVMAAGEMIDGITAAYQRILGGVLVTAVFVLLLKVAMRNHSATKEWRKAWPWVLANGLSGPALGVSCYQWALKTTPTGVVLPIVAITPLVIIPFSHYLEGERPTWRSIVGGSVAVLGAVALALNRYQ
jgi:drug/metabolite transporter (DMT)-like permease